MLKLLKPLAILLSTLLAQLSPVLHAATMPTETAQAELIPLPVTMLFQPLRADPKEPRFFVSKLRVDSAANKDTSIAAVGFGEHFGFIRKQSGPQQGWQLGLGAAVFAQFNLDTPSDDLLNADYTIGFPLSWRQNSWSGRIRLYHQSSHLGDEYLLNQSPQRINLSFEAVEVLFARDFGNLRLYGGGENIFSHEPADLGENILHLGFDWNSRENAFHIGRLGAARWVVGVDAKRWDQNNRDLQLSAKIGLEFAPRKGSTTPAQRWNLLLEYYDGMSPYGQFYANDVNYWGVAIQLGI